MVLLYEHPLSPFAQKVKIALNEKGVAYETRLPDLFTGSDQDFAAANPRMEVPALVEGDTRVFDSTIILEYIEDRWPTPPLLPATPAERANARMIEEVCDTYYEAINWGVAEIQVFQRAKGELAERMLGRASQQVAAMNVYLGRQLGAKQYLNGESFGWADLSAVPLVHAAAMIGNAPVEGSPLAEWLDRMRARPSVVSAFEAAASAFTGFEMLPQLVESGQFVREYRDHRLEWMLRSGGLEIVIAGMQKKNIRFSHELK